MILTPQQDDLVRALRHGPLTTGQCRTKLGIGMPATRVWELKHKGFDIRTETIKVKTRRPGQKARIAKYHLISEPGNQSAEQEQDSKAA